MFAHTDPLFKNLHILKAEDIFLKYSNLNYTTNT